MKATKLLGLLLILIMSLALTAACRRDEDETDEPVVPPVVVDETPAPTPEPEPEPTIFFIHEPRDLGGRVIRVASWWDMVGTHEEPDPATAADYFLARRMWENEERVRNYFNVSFERVLVTHGEMLAALTAHHIAGDVLGDWNFLDAAMFLPAILHGMILPISAYAPEGSDILGPRHYVMPVVAYGGEYWSFARNRLELNPNVIGINLNIINAIGAPNPVDLFYAGQWTWDAMLDLMRQASLAGFNGIGSNPATIGQQLLAANDASTITPDHQFNLDHPNAIAALEFLGIIFGPERLWHYNPIDRDNLWDWSRNLSGWAGGEVLFWDFVLWNTNQNSPVTFEWDIVPWPLGPNNTSGNSWQSSFPQTMTIPTNTINPEDVFIIFEEREAWAWGELELLEDQDPLPYWRTYLPTEGSVDRMMIAAHSRYIDLGRAVAGYLPLGPLVTAFWTQTATLMEVLESERPRRQEILDNVFRN